MLTLAGDEYREHGVFLAGDTADSVLLPGFFCNVCELFAKCDEPDNS